jgi:hypothetical protein
MRLARHGARIAAGLRQPLGERVGGGGAHGDRHALAGSGGLHLGVGSEALAHRSFERAHGIVAAGARLGLQGLGLCLQTGHLLQLRIEFCVLGRCRRQRAQRGRQHHPPEQGQHHQHGGDRDHALLARLELGPPGLPACFERFEPVHRAASA